MDNINAAIEAAAGKLSQAPETVEGKPETTPQTPESSVAQTPEKGKAENQAAPKEEQKEEFDGDVNKLPEILQPWFKKAQAGLTKKAMSQAELLRKGQEFEQVIQSEEWKRFQESKLEQRPEKPVQPNQSQTVSITAEEWEEAQLDSTGTKIQQIMSREIQRHLQEAAKEIMPKLQESEKFVNVSRLQNALSAFADIHPEILDYHQDGAVKDILDSELKSGKHASYESAINAAYERVHKIYQTAEQKALAKAQGRVAEKKGAVSSTGLTTSELTHIDANDNSDGFDKALSAALENKKVKVKIRK